MPRSVPLWLVALGLVATVVGCGSSSSPASSGLARVPLEPCKIDVAGMHLTAPAAQLVAELPDGSLVVGAARVHGSKLLVALRRVTPDCRAVRSFGREGTASVSVGSKQFGAIDALAATPSGQLLLAGSDGRRELVGRLLANGRLDRSFGRTGWTRLQPREKAVRGMPAPAFTATSIAIGPSGSIVLGGNDESAHCCVRDFVSELTAGGAPVRTFGDGGSTVLPGFAGSYTTDVSMAGDGSVYALGQYEQSGCGDPSIVRIRPDGSLDRRFDASIRRAIVTVATGHVRFTPTLVPRPRAGTFALVGGLDKTCAAAPPPPARLASGGIAVGMEPSGRIDTSYGRNGETRFPSPRYAFDSPTAIRLASGRILAAAVAYTANGGPEDLLVRAFEARGAIDRHFGSSGVQTIDLPRVPRTVYPNATLVPAPGGDAWLVVALPKEIDLTPLHAFR